MFVGVDYRFVNVFVFDSCEGCKIHGSTLFIKINLDFSGYSLPDQSNIFALPVQLERNIVLVLKCKYQERKK